MKLLIREAKASDVEGLLHLYNEATFKLIKQGIKQWTYPWEKETIEKLLSELVVLVDGQQIVGAMAISEMERFNEYLFVSPVLFLEKIVIHPAMQGNQLSRMLFDFARIEGKQSGKAVYFDCWAGNKKLIKHYLNYAKQVAVVAEEDYQVALFELF